VVLGDEEEDQHPDDHAEPTISLHALTGIQSRSGRTMQLQVDINRVRLTALVDSGSTHNFIDTDVASRVGIALYARPGLRVAVANGDRLTSPGCCQDLPIKIGDEAFSLDCYGLTLGTYDMVLGVQWLESLGPMLWDFRRRTLAFVQNGHHVVWMAAVPQAPQPCLLAALTELLEDLLAAFDDLFAEPTRLPPQRQRCHHIRLFPGTEAVTVRPYHHAHVQKAELERQCAEMLSHGVIRPSSSAFSAPVLLVKKSDGSWRFCVDYRALNNRSVKDKFPIPVIEELLDELRGASFFTKLDLRSGYHQVRMHLDDVEKTTFCTHEGLFEFLVMPFGLTNASVTFQALLNDVLRPFLRRFVLVFFDDILIYSKTWSEHLGHVRMVLQARHNNRLFVKKSKCPFGTRSVAYLGHVITADGVAMDDRRFTLSLIDWSRVLSGQCGRSSAWRVTTVGSSATTGRLQLLSLGCSARKDFSGAMRRRQRSTTSNVPSRRTSATIAEFQYPIRC
jgi:hypothetical protein